MRPDAVGMTEDDASQLWAMLGAEGKAPPELGYASHVLPSYSVAIQPWLDRLASRFLQQLCRKNAHFKLVLAPYGGGKTHFLLALGTRALAESFAVAYVPCGESISLDSPLDIHREVIKKLQLPEQANPGLRALIERVAQTKRQEIRDHGAPDVDKAFQRWTDSIRKTDYPENAFGRVMAAALRGVDDLSPTGEAAVRWLQGDTDTLTRDEMSDLRLARVPSRNRKEFGRNLLFSSVRFLAEAGVHGLVLLMDEVETLFTARGKALLRVLAAMRVLLDAPAGTQGGLPLFGVFSAVPDILDQLPKYPALQQRLAVLGAAFHEGNDLAIQLPLEKIESQRTLLAEIGRKLIEVGSLATGYAFDTDIQSANATRLAAAAASRNLDVDARRLFVKTWVNLLEMQRRSREHALDTEELSRRYQGSFDAVRDAETSEYEA